MGMGTNSRTHTHDKIHTKPMGIPIPMMFTNDTPAQLISCSMTQQHYSLSLPLLIILADFATCMGTSSSPLRKISRQIEGQFFSSVHFWLPCLNQSCPIHLSSCCQPLFLPQGFLRTCDQAFRYLHFHIFHAPPRCPPRRHL